MFLTIISLRSYANDSNDSSTDCIEREKVITFVADVIREKQTEIVKITSERDEWKTQAESSIRAAQIYKEKAKLEETRKKQWRTATFVAAAVTLVAGALTGVLVAGLVSQ